MTYVIPTEQGNSRKREDGERKREKQEGGLPRVGEGKKEISIARSRDIRRDEEEEDGEGKSHGKKNEKRVKDCL